MTKHEEMTTLQQIADLIAAAGADSYIAAAFAGCVEMARNNIENDWMLSYKETAEALEAKLIESRRDMDGMQVQIEKAEKRAISQEDATRCFRLARMAVDRESKALDKAAADIIEHAENPSSREFRDAVADHRFRVNAVEELSGLSERLKNLF